MKLALIDVPTERTTAATNAILALLALGCSLYLLWIGQNDPWKAGLWACILGLLALSAGLGAVAHGFKMPTKMNRLLWRPLYLVLGLTVSLFVVGVVNDLCGKTVAQQILPLMIIIGIVFYAVARLISRTFLVFIIYQAAAMLFALGTYAWLAFNGQLAGAWLMCMGVLVMMIGARIQARKAVSITIVWGFDHNGAYHLLQMAGVVFITAGLWASISVS